MLHLLPILAALTSPPAGEAPMYNPVPQGPLVEAELLTDFTEVVPGQAFWIGVTFDIHEDWHIYWPGQNDTGMTPIFDWRLPEGWHIGEARWPVPTRHVAPGELLDHVLEGRSTVFFPVKVAKDTPLGEGKLACEIEWLVCKVQCIDEQQVVETTLTIGDHVQRSPDQSELLAAAAAHLPRPIEQADDIETSVRGDVLHIKGPEGATLAFFPAADSRPVQNPLKSAQSRSNTLDVPLEAGEVAPVAGVIIVRASDGSARAWSFRNPSQRDAVRDGFEIEPIKQTVSGNEEKE